MPVPSVIADLSQTAASNYPAGTDSPATLDDVQRAHASFIALLRDGKGRTNRVTLASASTTDIGGQNSLFVEVTGTTTITSLGTSYNGPRYIKFAGALTLTHNATLMSLIGGTSITTAAGDFAVFVPNTAANGWDMVMYQRASGAALVAPGAATETSSGVVELATAAETQTGTDTQLAVHPAGLFAVTGSMVGMVAYFPMSSAPAGWLKANGRTIGSATSGATLRANADTSNLYTLLWNNVANTALPIQDSGGSATTRGASAAADFAANKRLPVPDLRAEFIRGLDDSRGVDTGRALASAQTESVGPHTHPISFGLANTSLANTIGSAAGNTTSGATGNNTGTTETRPRNVALLACIKY